LRADLALVGKLLEGDDGGYLKERRAALDAWGRFVMTLLTERTSNVVQFRAIRHKPE
jgi:hypothetical protein